MAKLRASWTPEIRQDLAALFTPSSPFYDPEIVKKYEDILKEECKNIDEFIEKVVPLLEK